MSCSNSWLGDTMRCEGCVVVEGRWMCRDGHISVKILVLINRDRFGQLQSDAELGDKIIPWYILLMILMIL